MNLHFISGLPRSGSTLLAAILRQNPRFRAAMSSPVASLFTAMQGACSRQNEGALFLDDDQKVALLRGVFAGYYHDVPAEHVVFDTNRMWCAKLPALVKLFPDAKVICCVRDVARIMDSFERALHTNPVEFTGLFGPHNTTTAYRRVNRRGASDGLVGFALDALREAFYGPFSDRLLLIDYEALVKHPSKTIGAIYDFVGEPTFEHDFLNVEYAADEFDAALGTPGLHTVKRVVEWAEQRSVLPPDMAQKFLADAFWNRPDEGLSAAALISLGG